MKGFFGHWWVFGRWSLVDPESVMWNSRPRLFISVKAAVECARTCPVVARRNALPHPSPDERVSAAKCVEVRHDAPGGVTTCRVSLANGFLLSTRHTRGHSMADAHREEVLNVFAAMALIELGVSADPETSHLIRTAQGQRRALPDVMIVEHGLRHVIEGKIADQGNAKDVVFAQARERIETLHAHIGVALVYPTRLRRVSFDRLLDGMKSEQSLEWIISTEAGSSDWSKGSLSDLVEGLRRTHAVLAQEDVVESAVELLRFSMQPLVAAIRTNPVGCRRCARVLGIITEEEYASSDPLDGLKADSSAQIAALTVANAVTFHSLLSGANPRVASLAAIFEDASPILRLCDEWKSIMDAINYVPIFDVARRILQSAPVMRDVDDAVKTLYTRADGVVRNRAALRHDLVGRIFHLLLLSAKHLGTFYTSVPAATLLLKLALQPRLWPAVNWADPEVIRSFRVADLACGTGTLLMAALQAASDNFVTEKFRKNERVDPADRRAFHRAMVEDVLHGYDVLASAVHLTASTLATLDPEVPFRTMNLMSLPHGRTSEGQYALGSLGFLKETTLGVQLDLMRPVEKAGDAARVTGSGERRTQATLPEIDLFVMNPPFVRRVGGNLLFGSLSETERSEMQKRLAKMLKAEADSTQSDWASTTAGLGSVFLAVAAKRLKSEGRLAFVLPASLATGVAWEKSRSMLSDHFILEYVVSSHDPEKWSFSESTDLSEILIVARRRANGENHGPRTGFVNLWKNMTSPIEALTIAGIVGDPAPAQFEDDHAISSIRLGDRKAGEAVSVPWNEIRDSGWYPATFAQVDVSRAARN
ncbi:MAG: hypothetical protein IT350_02640 [Deltaproteobacteria bacterium]|nr:hypothetical protein [Deltaproteobacteria bacterium]